MFALVIEGPFLTKDRGRKRATRMVNDHFAGRVQKIINLQKVHFLRQRGLVVQDDANLQDSPRTSRMKGFFLVNLDPETDAMYGWWQTL